MLSERFSISIAEVIIYSLLLPLALFVTIRHGMPNSIGFFYLCIFCCLRISAAALGIASENENHSNRTNLIWSEILGSVGIGPLLLAGFSLIERVNKTCNPNSIPRTHATRMLHIPNILALALAIVGGVRLSSNTPSQQRSGREFAQTGITIFMAVFIIYTLVCLATLRAFASVTKGEKKVVYGVLLAIPFLFIRILYAMLAVFKDNRTFAIVNGSATALLCMAIIEEMIVVIIYCGTGLVAPVEGEQKKKKKEEVGEEKKGEEGEGGRGRQRMQQISP
ncbi:MAG: hypothetical protein Q9186_002867 [Xanthomendoza sp. 1 TL-2023]